MAQVAITLADGRRVSLREFITMKQKAAEEEVANQPIKLIDGRRVPLREFMEMKQKADEEAARQRAAEEEAARQRAAEEEAARQRAAEEEAARQRAAEEEAARPKPYPLTDEQRRIIAQNYPQMKLDFLCEETEGATDFISALTREVPPSRDRLVPYYTKPLRSDMAVILVYFNPAMSVRVIQNLLTVKFWLDRARIPYFIGELAHHDNPFLFAPAANICQFRSASLMFYKENLIKAVEKIIPTTFTKLFFMDADILYKEPCWYDVVSMTLDHHDTCHPFQTAFSLDIDYSPNSKKSSILDAPSHTPLDWTKYHTGYCWAVKRRWYTRISPSDYVVIGGGDVLLYNYITKNCSITSGPDSCRLYKFIYDHIALSARNSYTTCPLTVVHLNHGTLERRQYDTRTKSLYDLITEINPDITLLDIVERRADGILEWKPEYRDALNSHYMKFFATRKDDYPMATITSTHRHKFFPIAYTPPSVKDMAVLLVFFNPVNYFRPTQNILMTKHSLESAGIPVYIAELAFDNEPFLFLPAPNIFQVRSTSYMFYKENLIAYSLRHIPSGFSKICLMDADIFYDRPNWYSIVSATLDHKNAIQPFKRANWLDIDFTVFMKRHNAIDLGSEKIEWGKHHPGFAYAFTIDFLRKFNIEDRLAITTGGDGVLSDMLCDRTPEKSTATTEFCLKNFIATHSLEDIRLGSCDLTIYHLNHGSRQNRHYYNIYIIHTLLKSALELSSYSDIFVRRDDGVLEWASQYRDLYNKIMRLYFHDRQEDKGDTEIDM